MVRPFITNFIRIVDASEAKKRIFVLSRVRENKSQTVKCLSGPYSFYTLLLLPANLPFHLIAYVYYKKKGKV